jgi:SAM-dependent methyltransferase
MNDRLQEAISARAFENRYQCSRDPWRFETPAYEQARYRCLRRCLSRPFYGVAFEPGCSIGVLTEALAKIAGRVIATDFAPTAVAAAKRRLGRVGNVDVRCADLKQQLPPGPLDLIVFSEIGYYFTPAELLKLARALGERLRPHGEFIAGHWLGHSVEHVIHGDAVHDVLRLSLPLQWVKGERHEGFRVDCWMKP